MTRRTYTVADNVRAELARRDLQQAQLADALRVSPAGISRRLAGLAKFSADELRQVATFLGVPVDALYRETDDRDLAPTGTSPP